MVFWKKENRGEILYAMKVLNKLKLCRNNYLSKNQKETNKVCCIILL